jgi:FMN-dependent NADH-azoreductase
MNLLHIVATPRDHKSNTLRVADAFLGGLQTRYGNVNVDVVDLFHRDLPEVAGDNIETKYTLMVGQPIDKQHQESWNQIELEIKRFLKADLYVLTTPMWNLSIPYALKYYIDAIIQPGYLFRYDELGQAIGLVQGKPMVCITSRGGDYSEASPFHAYDFQEPYLRAIFGFVGITDLHFINAQPMDITPELREAAVTAAIVQARSLAADRDWRVAGAVAEKAGPQRFEPSSLKQPASL